MTDSLRNTIGIYADRINFGRGRHLIKNLNNHERNLREIRKYLKYIDNQIEILQKPQEVSQSGKGILTTVPEIIEQVKLLVGEITSGNTNQTLKNELSELATYLYKTKHINKSQYNKLTNLII